MYCRFNFLLPLFRQQQWKIAADKDMRQALVDLCRRWAQQAKNRDLLRGEQDPGDRKPKAAIPQC
jgi:hypothetical protein